MARNQEFKNSATTLLPEGPLDAHDTASTINKISEVSRKDLNAAEKAGNAITPTSDHPQLQASALMALLVGDEPTTNSDEASTTIDEEAFQKLTRLAIDDDTEIKGKSNVKKKLQKKKHNTASSPSISNSKVMAPSKARFGFNDYRDELKCRRHGCGKLTNCCDGSTVICPRCGVKSYLRYCSIQCLLDPDMRYHWAQECGKFPLPDTFEIDSSTLIVRPANIRPYIECSARENPSRHRQAVFHSSNAAAGDYFVFNDHSLIQKEDLTLGVTAIGAGEVMAVVKILPDYGLYIGKSIFNEILEDCLRMGFFRPDKCLALVDVVTKQLVSDSQWNQEVQECLRFQMKNEFGYEIPQEMLLRFSTIRLTPSLAASAPA